MSYNSINIIYNSTFIPNSLFSYTYCHRQTTYSSSASSTSQLFMYILSSLLGYMRRRDKEYQYLYLLVVLVLSISQWQPFVSLDLQGSTCKLQTRKKKKSFTIKKKIHHINEIVSMSRFTEVCFHFVKYSKVSVEVVFLILYSCKASKPTIPKLAQNND